MRGERMRLWMGGKNIKNIYIYTHGETAEIKRIINQIPHCKHTKKKLNKYLSKRSY